MDEKMRYGWICPRCGKVNSPYRGTCECDEDHIVPQSPCPDPPPIVWPSYPSYTRPYEPWCLGPYYWDNRTYCGELTSGDPLPDMGRAICSTISDTYDDRPLHTISPELN